MRKNLISSGDSFTSVIYFPARNEQDSIIYRSSNLGKSCGVNYIHAFISSYCKRLSLSGDDEVEAYLLINMTAHA